jgi:hypothetical protein
MRNGTFQSPLRPARGDSLIFPGTLRSGSTASGLRAYTMGPDDEGFDGFSYALCALPQTGYGSAPLRHSDHTQAHMPTGEYPPRASHFQERRRILTPAPSGDNKNPLSAPMRSVSR